MARNKARGPGMSKLATLRNESALDNQAWELVYTTNMDKFIDDPEYKDMSKKEIMARIKKEEEFKVQQDNLKKTLPNGYGMNPQVEAISNSHTVSTISNYDLSKTSQKDQVQLDKLHAMRKGFFQTIEQHAMGGTSKIETGTNLIETAVGYSKAIDTLNYQSNQIKAHLSPEELKSVHNKIKSGEAYIAFDTETFGGKNAAGVQTFDGLFEVAYKYRDEAGDVTSKSFIMGLQPSQKSLEASGGDIKLAIQKTVDDYRIELEEGHSLTEPTSRNNILKKYFGMLGQSDTVLEQNDGLFSIKETNKDLNNLSETFSLEEQLAGLKKMQQITEQYYNVADGELPVHIKAYSDFLSILNKDNVNVVTQNGTQADMPWLNTQTNRIGRTLESTSPEIVQKFKTQSGLNKNYTIDVSGRHFDTLALFRQALSNTDKTVLHNSPEKVRKLIQENLSVLGQEGIRSSVFHGLEEALGLDKLAAHTAIADTTVLDAMLNYNLGEDFANKSLIDYMMDNLSTNTNIQTPVTTIKPGDMFIGNRNLMINDTTKGVFSFWRDPSSQEYKTGSGFVVGEEKASRSNMSQAIVKKDMIYNLEAMGELDTTTEFGKMMAGQFDEADVSTLYYAKVKPVYDKNIVGENVNLEAERYVVANSKEQLQSLIQNHLELIDENNIGERFTTATVKDGQIEYHQPKTLAEAISKSTEIEAADRLRRSTDNYSLFNYEAYKSIDAKMREQLGDEYTPEKSRKILSELSSNRDLVYAQKVASGKPIQIDFSILEKTLTWEGSDPLSSNRLANFVQSFEHMERISPLADKVLDTINKTMPLDKSLSKEEAAKVRARRKAAFDYTMKDILASETAEILAADPSIDPRAFYSSAKPAELFARDVDQSFTFDLPNYIKPNKEAKVIQSPVDIINNNLLEVGLSNTKSQEYALIKQITGLEPEVVENLSTSHQKITEARKLKEFVDAVKADGKYGGMFDKLEYTEHPVIYAENIINSIKTYKQSNPTVGLPSTKYALDLEQSSVALSSFLNKSTEEQAKAIASSLESMPKQLAYYGKADSEKHVKELAEQIINGQLFTELRSNGKVFDNAFDYAEAIGLDATQAKSFSRIYKSTRESYKEYTQNLIESIGMTPNTKIHVDPEGKVRFENNGKFMFDGKSIDELLPKVKTVDGQAYVEVGSRRFAFNAKLGFGKTTENQKLESGHLKKINIMSDIEEAISFVSKDSMYTTMKKSAIDGDVEKAAKYLINKVTGKVGSGSAIGYSPVERKALVNFDYSELEKILPIALEQGIFDGKEFRDSGFFDAVKSLSKGHAGSEVKQILQKNYHYALNIIGERMGVDSELKEIFKHVNTDTKDKNLAKGVGTIGHKNHIVGSTFNNMGRPVPYSANKLKSKNAWQESLDTNYKGNNYYHIEPMLTTKGIEKFSNQEIEHIGQTTNTVVAGKLNMSNKNFRKIETELLARYDKDSKEYKILKAYLDKVNLFEQEKLLDSEFFDNFFSDTQIQKVSKSKSLYFNEHDKAVAKSVAEGKDLDWNLVTDPEGKVTGFKYGKGIDKSRGDILAVQTGHTSSVDATVANYDGKLKIGFLKEDLLIDEKEISKNIVGMSPDQAKAYIEKTYGQYETRYLKATSAGERRKILNGAVEKDAARSLTVGLGEYNDSIKEYLKTSERYQKYIGKSVHKDVIQEILDDFKANNVFQSKQQLADAIQEERHFVSRTLKKYIQTEYNISHDFAMIANHDNIKHNNVMFTLTETLETMRAMRQNAGQSFEEATSAIAQEIEAHQLFNFGDKKVKYDSKTNKIYLPDAHEYEYTDVITKGLADILEENKDGFYSDLYTKIDGEGQIGIRVGNIASYTMTTIQEGDYHQYPSSSKAQTKQIDAIQNRIDALNEQMKTLPDIKTSKNQQEMLEDFEKRIDRWKGKVSEYESEIKQGNKVSYYEERLRIAKGHVDASIKERDIYKAKYGVLTEEEYEVEKVKISNQKEKIKEQIRNLKDEQSLQKRAINDQQHQRKFGTRDREMLGLQIIDDDYLTILNGIDPKLSDKLSNNVGKAALSSYIDTLDDLYYKGKAGDDRHKRSESVNSLRQEVNERYTDENVREGVYKTIKNAMYDNKELSINEMSYAKAEDAYTLSMGIHANRFNQRTYIEQSDIENLQKSGFNKISIDEVFNNTKLSPDDILNDPNSIYNKNTIIDLSKYIDPKSGDAYIAMPYTSASVSGDELIRKNFQKKLGSTMKYVRELEELTPGSEEYKQVQGRLIESISGEHGIKNQIVEDLGGKKGVFGRNSYAYQSMSMYGTAEVSQWLQDSNNQGYENWYLLDQAKFNGQTIKEHLSQNKFLDVTAVNDASMERMGLYDLDLMKETLSKEDVVDILTGENNKEAYGSFLNNARSSAETERALADFNSNASLSVDDVTEEHYRRAMRYKLGTEGVNADTVRYPNIMRGSASVGKLYLDTNLSDQEVKTMSYSWLKKNGDLDTDSAGVSVIMDKSGRISLNKNYDEMLDTQVQAKMYHESVTENLFYQVAAMQQEEKDSESIFKRTDYRNAASEALHTDNQFGYISSQMMNVPEIDTIKQNQVKMDELKELYKNKYGSAPEGRFDLGDKDNVEKLGSLLNDMSQETGEEYRKAILFEQSLFKSENYQHNKIGIDDVGQINNPLFQKRRNLDMYMHHNKDFDFEKRETMFDVFNELEQSVISSKKIKDARTALDKTQKFTDILRNIDSSQENQRYAAEEQLRSWLSEYGNLDKVMEKHKNRIAIVDEYRKGNNASNLDLTNLDFDNYGYKDQDSLIDDIVDMFRVTASPDTAGLVAKDKVGTGVQHYSGAQSFNMENVAVYEGANNFNDKTIQLMASTNTEIETGKTMGYVKPQKQYALETPMPEVSLHSDTSAARQGAADMVKSFVEGSGKVMSEALSNNRTLGVMGIAIGAGVAIAGIVGGNPSVPAETQAMQQSQGEQGHQAGGGSNYSPQSMPSNNGYVVNVKGRGSSEQINNTAQSLQAAMAQSFSTNVNISMNVMTSGGMSNREVQQIISDAIG